MSAEIPYVRGVPNVPMVFCSVHHTATAIDTRKPAPPPDQVCVECLRERQGEPATTGTESIELIQRSMSWDGFSPAARRKFEEQRAQAEADGKAVPGSLVEQEALDSMDETRPKVIKFDHTPRHLRGKRRGYQPPAFREEQFA